MKKRTTAIMIYKKILFYVLLFISVLSCSKTFDKEKYLNEIFEKYEKPLTDFNLIEIDCKKQDSLFLQIYNTDQEARNTGLDYVPIDKKNLQLFVSAVEKCSFPYDEEFNDFRSYVGIFLVLQHNDPEWIAFYYDDFKKLIENKKLPKDILALLEDRFLLQNNKPQLYGTQIKNGKLYDVINPSELKERRESMNFKESIEDYLSRYGLNFNEEIKKMTSNKENLNESK